MAQAHKLRKGRVSEANRIYFITITCWRRTPIFHNRLRGRCAVRAMMRTQSQATTLCYVVMPDHVHWMMQLQEHSNLSIVVQKMKTLTTRNLRLQGHSKEVWQRGFHDHAVRKGKDIRAIARYTVANPLRAGLVKDYPLWDAIWLD